MYKLRISLHKVDINLNRNDRIRTCDFLTPNETRYQLRYIPIIGGFPRMEGTSAIPYGGAEGTRTLYLFLAREVLSQLSYSPINKTVFLLTA